MVVVRNGYLSRKTVGRSYQGVMRPRNKKVKVMHREVSSAKSYRDWWLGNQQIRWKSITLPRELWGKRIRFKVEVLDE